MGGPCWDCICIYDVLFEDAREWRATWPEFRVMSSVEAA